MGRILTAVMMVFFIAGAADKALLKGRLGWRRNLIRDSIRPAH